MKCTKCGKTFASHTDGPEICFDCYMKDINNYQGTNNSSNCDMPLHQDFSKKEGWICPVCGRGVAPWMSFCPCQSNWKITYGTGTGTGTYTNLNSKEFENKDLLEG